MNYFSPATEAWRAPTVKENLIVQQIGRNQRRIPRPIPGHEETGRLGMRTTIGVFIAVNFHVVFLEIVLVAPHAG